MSTTTNEYNTRKYPQRQDYDECSNDDEGEDVTQQQTLLLSRGRHANNSPSSSSQQQQQQQQEGDKNSRNNAAQVRTISSFSKKIDWLFQSDVGGGVGDNDVNACKKAAAFPSQAGRDYSSNGASIENEKNHRTEFTSPPTEEPAVNDRQASIKATTTTRTNSVESDGASIQNSNFALSIDCPKQDMEIQPSNTDDDHRENQTVKSNPNGSGRIQQEQKEKECYKNRMLYLQKIRNSLEKEKLDVLPGEQDDRKSHSCSLPSLHLIDYAENNSDGSSVANEAGAKVTRRKDENGEQRMWVENSKNWDETSRIQKQEEEMARMEEDFLLDIEHQIEQMKQANGCSEDGNENLHIIREANQLRVEAALKERQCELHCSDGEKPSEINGTILTLKRSTF
mmetsp:Transcript_19612/g.30153  ORF Transcript_19612/g.30153 Transcript_19612/m.30153 type:complete len:396 (-) Transcript_19612:375-1562(-)